MELIRPLLLPPARCVPHPTMAVPCCENPALRLYIGKEHLSSPLYVHVQRSAASLQVSPAFLSKRPVPSEDINRMVTEYLTIYGLFFLKGPKTALSGKLQNGMLSPKTRITRRAVG